MMQYTYLFEAHSIQRYVMGGGKLADMVGASELLEVLTNNPGSLDQALKQLGLSEGKKHDYVFSRRGGGAFFIVFKQKEHAISLRNLWSLIPNSLAPGLEWNHAIGEGKTQKQAIQDGQKKLRLKRNQPTRHLPESNPVMQRNPRTGLAATSSGKAPNGQSISLDASTLAKQKYSQGDVLFDKFIASYKGSEEEELIKKNWSFPRNLDHTENDRVFPYKGDNHIIAIIHADGNGLGQILMRLAQSLEDSEHYADVFYELSKKIDLATRKAAQKALMKVKGIEAFDVLPIRPLILGGDDLTIMIRGDLALNYAKDFLTLFEQETKQELAELHQQYKLDIPEYMTACAGIAFVRSNQPFYLGYQLAESLCSHAKATSRATKAYKEGNIIPASLAFYHVTTSMIDDYADIQKTELTVSIDHEEYLLSLGAYGVSALALHDSYDHDNDSNSNITHELPSLSALQALKETFSEKQVAKGSARHLLTLLHVNPDDAKSAYQRWRMLMQSNDQDKKVLNLFDTACAQLFPENQHHSELPFANFAEPDKPAEYRTFLGDLISMIAIEKEL